MPYLALLQEGIESIPKCMEKAQRNFFNVIAVPINCKDLPLESIREPMCEQQTNQTYSDLIMTAEQWTSKIIAILSDDIDADSNDRIVRQNSEEILKRDLAWASHLQYAGYILVRLKSLNNTNLARVVTSKIKGVLLVQVPLFNIKVAHAVNRRDIDNDKLEKISMQDTWSWWNNFRISADYNPKMKVVLQLHESDQPSLEEIRRWLGEPVEALIIPSSMFVRNRYNNPVLTKVWQEIIKKFIKMHVSLIVSTDTDDNNLKLYAEYLNSFRETHKDAHPLQAFEDVLEVPLQPLYDNLDCYTYEIFEKDPVKYKLYQNAIEQALIDRVPDEEIEERLTVIMVLGAGRGPLVRSTLNAAATTKRKVRIYIIEKNPNAIRTLHAIAKKLWHKHDVHIFSKDMREFSPPELADIIVSELLGSFGDNELSPECLDCAQRLLKSDGISIPSKSTSYINPIMSTKLLNAVRTVLHSETFARDKVPTQYTHAENGYVALLKNFYNIDRPQALFEFVHPNYEIPINNNRFKILNFVAKLDCIITGFAGYFDSVLYGDTIMSIHPETHTKGMPSWFPMYFPLSEPVHVKQGNEIVLKFWRCATKQKVWYEWCLSSPQCTHVHNLGGRTDVIYCS